MSFPAFVLQELRICHVNERSFETACSHVAPHRQGTWDPHLATMFERIAAEYDRRADEESRGDEPPRDQK